MGTGNDLARILNWGQGEDSAVDVSVYLKRVLAAKVVALDRYMLPRVTLRASKDLLFRSDGRWILAPRRGTSVWPQPARGYVHFSRYR